MAKTWSDYMPLLAPHIGGCPTSTLKTYLAQASADFFARTHLWRGEIDAIYLAPGQVEYDLDSDAVVEHVISVVHKGSPLTRTDLRLIPQERLDETGDPVAYWIEMDNSIRVFPSPTERSTMKVYAVLKTSRAATGTDDWIYETWADALVSGTVALVASMPDKDWTDLALAGMHKGLYERAITNARIRDLRGVRMAVRQRPAA